MKKILLGVSGLVAVFASGAAGAIGVTLDGLQAASGSTTLFKDIRRTDQLCDRAARTWQAIGDKTFTLTEIITNSSNGARAAGTTGCFSSVRYYTWLNSQLLMTKREFLNSSDEIVSSSTYNPGVVTDRANMAGRFAVWQKISTTSIFTGTTASGDTWTTSYSKVNRPVRTEAGAYMTGCVTGDISSGDQTYSMVYTWCQGQTQAPGSVIINERLTNATGGVLYNKSWVNY